MEMLNHFAAENIIVVTAEDIGVFSEKGVVGNYFVIVLPQHLRYHRSRPGTIIEAGICLLLPLGNFLYQGGYKAAEPFVVNVVVVLQVSAFFVFRLRKLCGWDKY